MGMFGRRKFRTQVLYSIQILWVSSLALTLLAVFSGELYGAHCPPGDIGDCQKAVESGAPRNPLWPLAGAAAGAVPPLLRGRRRRPEPQQDGKKREPDLKIQNPWTGKPLTVWEPGRFGPGENGNPGEPGMVWWGGNWIDPEEARERINESLAADHRREAESEAFAQESQQRSEEWMRNRVQQLQQEAERERQDAERERQAQEDARKALRNIEDIADRHGYDDIWNRAQEKAFRPDGSLDADYLNRLRDTLRNRLGRDQAFPNEPQQNWIAEGLSNTWNDARHNPLIRIGSGVLTGGASEVFFQSQGAWEAMQQSFNQAADRGRAWDMTDAVRSGYGQFLRGNLPLNTINALRDPKATWGEVAMGAGLDAFTGLGLRNTINNVRGSMSAFQAGESWRNVVTQGGGPRNPFRPTSTDGGAAPGMLSGGEARSAVDAAVREGKGGVGFKPLSTLSPPLPSNWPSNARLASLRRDGSMIWGTRESPPLNSGGTPIQWNPDACGIRVAQGMMRDANRGKGFVNLPENQAMQKAIERGWFTPAKPGREVFAGQNTQELRGMLQRLGARTTMLQSDTVAHYQRHLAAGRQLAASVGNGNGFFHRVRIEGMTPDGHFFSIGDPNTGRSYLVAATDFIRQVNPGRTLSVRWP